MGVQRREREEHGSGEGRAALSVDGGCAECDRRRLGSCSASGDSVRGAGIQGYSGAGSDGFPSSAAGTLYGAHQPPVSTVQDPQLHGFLSRGELRHSYLNSTIASVPNRKPLIEIL